MKLLFTLRARLICVVLIAVIPLFVYSVAKSAIHINTAIQKATENLEFTASQVASTQERVADSAHQILTAISKVPTLLQSKSEECHPFFKALNEELTSYTNMGFMGANGYIQCHSRDLEPTQFNGDRDYFKKILAGSGFAVSNFQIGKGSGKPVIAFASPVKNGQGVVQGVVYVSIQFAELSKALSNVKLPDGSDLFITDRNGVVLAVSSGNSAASGEPLTNPMLLAAVKAGQEGIIEIADSAGMRKIHALIRTSSKATDTAFYVVVNLDRNQIIAPAREQLVLELLGLLLVTGIGCATAWAMGGRSVVQPTLEILDATRKIQNGMLDVRIPIAPDAPGHELTRIAQGVNRMADTIEQQEIDLKRALERSQRARNTLDLTLNSMQDGLIALDASGNILSINKAAFQTFPMDPGITPLSSQWPGQLGLYVPGTSELFTTQELPFYKALHGQEGGPQHIWVKNLLVPEGRLISVRYRPIKEGDELVGALALITDITEMDRLQLEQARSYATLQEAQRKLLDAQQLCRIGNWEFDFSSQVLTWSDELYTLCDLEPGSFDGRFETFVQLIHPDDRIEFVRRRELALQQNSELDIEFRIITPKGSVRWLHQQGRTHFASNGVPCYRSGVMQDITERKHNELALAHSTAILARTEEMAMIGGWELDVKNMQLQCSEQMLAVHDLAPGSELTAKQARNVFVPSCRGVLVAAVEAAIHQGTPWDLELCLVTTKGRTVWVRSQGRAVMLGGVCQRLLGAMQDITAQHQSQKQLRLLEACITHLNDVVIITEVDPKADPSGRDDARIVFVNDTFERRTGYSREEVLGKSPRILQGPNTQRSELDRVGAALKNWQPVCAELINYTKSGEEFWIEMDIVPIADNKGWYTHWVAIERDITQRKLAKKALLESEKRYTALFETAPIPMWAIDDDSGRFLIVNSAATKTYGYSKEEFLSMTLFDIRPESEHVRLRADLAETASRSDSRGVWLHRRKDGLEFPVNIFANSIQSNDKPARFIVALDITGQVKAKKEIQEHLFTLQRAADAAQAITWHQTLEGTLQEVADQARGVIGANHAAVSLAVSDAGLSATTVVSLSSKYAVCHDQIKASDNTGVYAMVSEGIRAVRMMQSELEAHPRWSNPGDQAGQHPSLRGWLAVPLLSRNGDKMGVLQLSDKYEGDFTQHDEYVVMELAQLASIAIQNAQLIEEVNTLNAGLERKVAERTVALARQEALFRALSEQAPQVVWTSNMQGELTYANQAWFELAGGSLQDWAGSQWFTAIHPEDLPEVKANWKLCRASGSPFMGIRRFRAKNGVYHTMSYRAAPVLDAQGEMLFWVGIDADITEVKNIESALRLSNQELEAFSYSVSHDLRSPLNTIDGFSRLLSKHLNAQENVNVKGQHYLSRIQAGVTQMGKLIEDLLSLSQVSRIQLNYQPIDLSVMSQNILDEWRVRQPERRVSIDVQSGLQAQGDVRLAGALMENLLGNAWKFTSKKPDARISVGQDLDAAGLPVFFVRDNGAGFDMAYAEKLFIAFQRLHTESEFPGTGVGLATVSRVVGRHGGRLWAESQPEHGATFFFTLPDRLPLV